MSSRSKCGGRSYFKELKADASSTDNVAYVAAMVALDLTSEDQARDVARQLSVCVVTGGITNSLFCVSGFTKISLLSKSNNAYFDPFQANEDVKALDDEDSVLVRIFGAEGMIDRDVETLTYAQLCDADVAHRFIGRFENGRIEGWLSGYRPLNVKELSVPEISTKIAVQMARLHTEFHPTCAEGKALEKKAGMWDQLWSWMEQAFDCNKYPWKGGEDDEKRCAKMFDLHQIESSLKECQTNGSIPDGADVAFCHNDLLAANIMISETNGDIQLIDFEYGGYNYRSFDIANHFNEWAGGTDNGKPDYNLFPTQQQGSIFLDAYIKESQRLIDDQSDGSSTDVSSFSVPTLVQLTKEVDAFVLVNHLYWGLWAVNQAKAEGCDDFDYLLFASNRFGRFFSEKQEQQRECP